ncbi:MAG TPA: DNA replication/repair protein RecF [Alphaproteobacteria bacterium]|nr:DNA replication/repair protein RecF [Alphaproteobacteria bacterium]
MKKRMSAPAFPASDSIPFSPEIAPRCAIVRLSVSAFRSHARARMEGMGPGAVVLTGPNGAGKTNVLEAVSMLAPGRGLRGARLSEMQHRDHPQGPGWAVAAEISGPFGPVKLGSGWDAAQDRRLLHINDAPARSRTQGADFLSLVWLTPRMDGLFVEGAGARRRFLDRLVFGFDPGHAGRVTRYENALAQRAKLLREGGARPAWLEALELQMAATGVAIAAARLDFAARLGRAAGVDSSHGAFPTARLWVEGALERALEGRPALEVEEDFAAALRTSREADSRTGGAASGPHRSDLAVVHAQKSMAADQCSTGEQKALLIGLILAHARLIRAERGAPPVLLLDEVAAHLDAARRTALFGILDDLGVQAWMTGTEASPFEGLRARTLFALRDGQIVAE